MGWPLEEERVDIVARVDRVAGVSWVAGVAGVSDEIK